MRVALAILTVVIAGCMSSAPAATPDPSVLDWTDPDFMLSATAEDALLIVVVPLAKQPYAATLQALDEELTKVFGAEAFEIRVAPAIPADLQPETWTRDDVLALMAHVDATLADHERRVQVIWLPGEAYDGRRLAGVALFHAAILFPEAWTLVPGAEAPTDESARPIVERVVTVHEVGHVLGLVNFRIPMLEPRLPSPEDDPCQCHSNRDESVMQSAVGSLNALLDAVGAGEEIPFRFDVHDLEDLRVAREHALASSLGQRSNTPPGHGHLSAPASVEQDPRESRTSIG